MSLFSYTAKTKEGESRSGTIETTSQESALDLLHQQGLIVVSIGEAEKPSLLEMKIPFLGGVRQKDVVIFSRQLATLFEAQIPVTAALKTLVGETARLELKTATARILDDVIGGMALSQAMAKRPDIFSSFYISLVRSGEESGKLQETFTYLADYLERSYYLMSKARNSLIYPAFILFAFFGVLVVMLTVVVPQLSGLLKETGQELPVYTQIIINISEFLRSWGLVLLMLLVAAVFLLWRWSLTPKGKYFFDDLKLNIPIVGELFRKLYMARFSDNLRTLIVGGIPIIKALEITRDVVGNAVYQKAVNEAIESVRAGNTISAALEQNPEVPVLVTQMLKVGEAAGRIEFILSNVAKFYEREVNSAIENLVSLIEPALIIFLGVGIGVLVASILVPLYNLVGAI